MFLGILIDVATRILSMYVNEEDILVMTYQGFKRRILKARVNSRDKLQAMNG